MKVEDWLKKIDKRINDLEKKIKKLEKKATYHLEIDTPMKLRSNVYSEWSKSLKKSKSKGVKFK